MTTAPNPDVLSERRPYVAGSQALLEKRPRRRVDVEELTPADGDGNERVVLLHPDDGRYLELSPLEASIWRLSDGTRTTRDLIGEGLDLDPPIAPNRVGECLLRFAREGLLVGQWGNVTGRRSGVTLGRVEAQSELDGSFRVFVVFFLALLPLMGLLFLGGLFGDRGFHLVPPEGTGWGLLLSVLLLVSWRQAMCGCAVILSGRDIPSWGIGLIRGVPGLFVDTSSMILASRSERMRVHLAGLYAPIALASIAALAMQLNPRPPEHLLMQIAAVGLLGLFVAISPVHDTDGYRLYQLLIGREGLREKAFDFLSRRLNRKIRSEKISLEERDLLIFGLASLVWSIAAVGVGFQLFQNLRSGQAAHLITAGTMADRVILISVTAAVLGATFHALALILWAPLAWVLRPFGRHVLASFITPVALLMSVGILVLGGSELAPILTTVAGLAAVLPLLRASSSFVGSPVSGMLLSLAACAGVHSTTLALAAAHTHLQVSAADWTMDLLGLIHRGGTLFLAIAAWSLHRETRHTALTPAEQAVMRALGAALAVTVVLGLVRRPDLFGLLGAVDLAAGVGLAIAALPSIVMACQAPARQFWRPLGLCLLALAASGAVGFTLEPGYWPSTASLRFKMAAWPLAIAAALASRLWLRQGWKKRSWETPVRPDSPVRKREVLIHACQTLVGGMIRLFLSGQGERKTEGLVRGFNQLAEQEMRGELMLVERELDVARWEAQGVEWLTARLQKAITLFHEQMTVRAGRRFAHWVRTTTFADLYWFEQELLRHHLPGLFPVHPGEVPASDRLDEISRVPFFAVLEEDEFAAVVRVLRLRRFLTGEVVVRQGDEANEFLVVARGELVVLRDDEDRKEQVLGHFVAGDCFGESAFVESGRRTASVAATEAVELYSLSRVDLEALLRNDEAITRSLELLVQRGGFLRNVPMLSVLPSTEIGKLAACLVLEEFGDQKTVLKLGDELDRMLLVQEGTLGVFGTGSQGVRVRKDTLKTGRVIGEKSLLGISRRDVTLVAETHCRLLSLHADLFERVLTLYLQTFGTLDELATPRADLR